MNKNLELRKLPVGSLFSLANILETNDEWKRIMAIVPKDLDIEHFEPKYNSEHMRLIEDHAKTTNKKCAEIFFDEWGTSGRVRPTLDTLMKLLLKAQAYRAADEIAGLLRETPPERPNEGPAASIDTNITELLHEESTRKLSSDKKDNENSFGDKTTKQMKSVSDFIKFSTNETDDIHSSDAIHNATTVQVNPGSDLIKFSSHISKISQVYLDTANIPKFSEIMVKSEEVVKTNSYHTLENTDSSSQVLNLEIVGHDKSDVYTTTYQISFPNIDIESETIDRDILEDDNLVHFEFSCLEDITNNFSSILNKNENGSIIGKIGSGGFGEVFAGFHVKYGPLAIKKSYNNFSTDHKPDIVVKVFNSEVKYLSKFRHKNIVPIIGFSIDGPSLCTVCEYIDGGSLEQKISEKVLTEFHRLNIALGTAEGLNYLHKNKTENEINSNADNFIHGDVKSANILLTRDFCPKLCDFGLARQFEATFVMTTPMGTSAYMAPEGFSGTITQKIDIYSYGIVLLELLTGLKAIVSYDNEKINIKEYVEENVMNDQITHLLDPAVAEWTIAENIYSLALTCLDGQRKNRPSTDEICNTLYCIKK